MKKYKVKLKYDMVNAIHRLLHEGLADVSPFDDNERLLFATLNDVRRKLYQKLEAMQHDYKLTLAPNEAIALRIFYTEYCEDGAFTSLSNKMRMIAEEVHQLYC
jgi:hypothetical protein